MICLRTRSAVVDNPQFQNRFELLSPDNSTKILDKMTSKVIEHKHPAPLGDICNLHVQSITAKVNRVWSYIETSVFTVPAQSLGHDNICPPPEAADIQDTKSKPSLSVILPASDILAHAISCAIQTVAQTKGFTRTVKFSATRSPIPRLNKRPRTPFPGSADARRNTPESDSWSSSPKRSRITLLVDSPLPPKHAATSNKVEERSQTNLHQLVRWLTGYIYFLITSPDRASRATGLVEFSAQETVMGNILDILIHYHPNNAIIFLALWYLERLFPRALVASGILAEQDIIELISRMFLLGLLIANKWLDDFWMSLKDWCKFCSLSVSSAREIERSALTILDYNISISNPDWVAWLFDMRASASSYPPLDNGKAPVITIVNSLLSAGPKVSRKYLHSCPKPIARPTPFELSSKFYSQVMRNLCVPKLLEPSPCHSISDPAPWNPAEDPIITPLCPWKNKRDSTWCPTAYHYHDHY